MVILLRESWEYEERTAQARYMARRRRISSHATPLRHTIDGFALGKPPPFTTLAPGDSGVQNLTPGAPRG